MPEPLAFLGFGLETKGFDATGRTDDVPGKPLRYPAPKPDPLPEEVDLGVSDTNVTAGVENVVPFNPPR